MTKTHNFEELIKDNHSIIYSICRVYSENKDFDDLYQEILISLWKSLPSFEGRSKLSTWLYRVTLNTALTYRRNNKKYKAQASLSDMPPVPDTKEPIEKEQQIEQLYAAISRLNKDDRSIILLYLEERSYEEIADVTGLTISNVGVKINRLKKKLFKILSEIRAREAKRNDSY